MTNDHPTHNTRRSGSALAGNTPRIILADGDHPTGWALARSYLEKGWRVIILTRHPLRTHADRPSGCVVTYWNNQADGLWTLRLEGATRVTNLAGRHPAMQKTPYRRRLARRAHRKAHDLLQKACARCFAPPELVQDVSPPVSRPTDVHVSHRPAALQPATA